MAEALKHPPTITIDSESDAEAAIASLRRFGDWAEYPHAARMYGIGYWLKKRFRLPQFISLDNWEILHYPPDSNEVRDGDRGWAIPFLLYNRTQKKNYDKAGKSSLLVGSAFRHCREIEDIRPSPSARGTLAFPAHSTLHVDSSCDWDRYADALLALPERFQPVSVCLYFKELMNLAYRPFIRRGITVHCAGHLLDDRFPLNFYNILRNFKYSTGNMVGSSAYYSIDFGIPFFIYGPDVKLLNDGDDSRIVANKETGYFDLENSMPPELKKEFEMFSFPMDAPITLLEEHRAYVAERLGADNEYGLVGIHWAVWTRYLRLLATAAPRSIHDFFVAYKK